MANNNCSTAAQRSYILSLTKSLGDEDFLHCVKKFSQSSSKFLSGDTLSGTRIQVLNYLTKKNASACIEKLLQPGVLDNYDQVRIQGEGHDLRDGIYLVNRIVSCQPRWSGYIAVTFDIFHYGQQVFNLTLKQYDNIVMTSDLAKKSGRGHHQIFVGVKQKKYVWSAFQSAQKNTVQYLRTLMGEEFTVPCQWQEEQFLKEGLAGADTVIAEMVDDMLPGGPALQV